MMIEGRGYVYNFAAGSPRSVFQGAGAVDKFKANKMLSAACSREAK